MMVWVKASVPDVNDAIKEFDAIACLETMHTVLLAIMACSDHVQ